MNIYNQNNPMNNNNYTIQDQKIQRQIQMSYKNPSNKPLNLNLLMNNNDIPQNQNFMVDYNMTANINNLAQNPMGNNNHVSSNPLNFNKLEPNPLNINNNVDPVSFNACNEGIANGFGAMFFNLREPGFTRTNDPVKKDSNNHVAILIVNIILYAGIGVAIAGIFLNFLSIGGIIGMIVGAYVFYLIICCYTSQIRNYIHNMKVSAQYFPIYEQLRQGKGYFQFFIECYHYQTTRTRKGRTQRKKVVTHTAKENFEVSASFDQSGQLTSLKNTQSYVFIHYLKRYYFSDDASQQKFVNSFNNFVAKNRRDQYQSFSHDFDIPGYQQFAAFTESPQGGKSKAIFYLFTLLGFGFLYSFIFERFIERYEVGLLKKLTI